jgi:heme/copper-type cytochrome/quinol oxidase subunit 1
MPNAGKDDTSLFSLFLMILGGYGFVFGFFLSGLLSVPRRFASYNYIALESVRDFGIQIGYYSSICVFVFIVGLILAFKSFLKKKIF